MWPVPGRQAGHAPPAHLASGTPVLSVLIVLAVVLVGLVGGAGVIWLSLLVAGPALAATTSGPRGVLCVGLLAAVLGAALGLRGGLPGRELVAVLSGLAAVTLASGLSGALRGRRERVLAAVRSVAEAAQHALLRPVPATVGRSGGGPLQRGGCGGRFGRGCTALLSTPYGVRLIVGDVRGKGLPAVSAAALVLGVFQEAAYDEPDLLAVVARIERSLARDLIEQLRHRRCGRIPAGRASGGGELRTRAAAVGACVRRRRVGGPHPSRPPLGLSALAGETPAFRCCPRRRGSAAAHRRGHRGPQPPP